MYLTNFGRLFQLLSIILPCCMFTISLIAQANAPCSDPGYRQFDFWLGDWTVYHTQADTVVGHNSIKSILNGCVVEENWTGSGGFTGKSFNTYNPTDSLWQQLWVDMSGARYEFSGRYADHVMALKGEAVSNNGKALFTLTFSHDPEKDEVRQVWQMSSNEGKDWNTIFDGTYRRQ